MGIDSRVLNKIYRFECAVYEYSGIQRVGKSTLMVSDLMRFLNYKNGYDYKPNEVYVNFWLDVTGVNICDNEKMLWTMQKARKELWTHKLFAIDECSQPPLFYARNSKDKIQTELVTSLWQMPKKRCQFLYSSNIGNSVDVQMRDATWYSILPFRYNHNSNRDRETIDFRVAHGYEVWENDYTFFAPAYIQQWFDSDRAIT